ncbi:MAG: hypothetical protein WBP26_04905 [Candidatus Saccharimonadales bacterium]
MRDIESVHRPKPKQLTWRAGLLAAGLALTACTSGNSDPVQTSASTAVSDSKNRPPSAAATFTVLNFTLPQREALNPRFMSVEQCYLDFWKDEDGSRQPVVGPSEIPEGFVTPEHPVVRVDGRCNTPLDNEQVGLYEGPSQDSDLVMAAINGDALYLSCYVEDGQPIQDVRGPVSSSDVWFEVVASGGVKAYAPSTNIGYPSLAGMAACP